MSDLFQTYQQDFIKSLSSTQRKLQSILATTTPIADKAFSDIKQQLTEAQKSLKFMQTQAGSLPPHIRPKFQQKATKYKREYNDIKRKIYRKEEEHTDEKNKQALMVVGNNIEEKQNAKEKLIGDGQVLSDATYKLKDSVFVMRETEGISNDVQIELVSHTDRLNKNKEKLITIDEDLTESNQLITKMAAIIRRNKLVCGVVFGIVILACIIITAMMIIKKNKENAANNTPAK